MARTSGEYCIYRVTAQHNALIREDDFFKGRLLETDWVAGLGQGRYLLLQVQGRLVTGKPEYPLFHSKPPGKPIRWAITLRDLAYLQAGDTIEAPMDLDAFAVQAMTAYVGIMRARKGTRMIVGEAEG